MDIETKTETKVTESKKLFNFFRADAYGEADQEMTTPYLVMIEGLIEAGKFKLNISKMDQVLEESCGCYELIAKKIIKNSIAFQY